MIEIDWRLALGIVVLLGTILLAAAKSIFVTKAKIYDEKGITIFTPREELKELCQERRDNFEAALEALKKIAATVVSRPEWEGSYKEREQRHAAGQKSLCKKLDDLQKGQTNIDKSLAKLYGLLEKKDSGIQG